MRKRIHCDTSSSLGTLSAPTPTVWTIHRQCHRPYDSSHVSITPSPIWLRSALVMPNLHGSGHASVMPSPYGSDHASIMKSPYRSGHSSMISSAYRVGPLQVGPIVTTIWNPQYVKEVQAGRSIIQFLIRRIEQFLN